MTNHHIPESRRNEPPTPRQLSYIRGLAQRANRTVVMPRTKAQASRVIEDLKRSPQRDVRERFLERDGTPGAYGTAVRADEITGCGSTAAWA